MAPALTSGSAAFCPYGLAGRGDLGHQGDLVEQRGDAFRLQCDSTRMMHTRVTDQCRSGAMRAQTHGLGERAQVLQHGEVHRRFQVHATHAASATSTRNIQAATPAALSLPGAVFRMADGHSRSLPLCALVGTCDLYRSGTSPRDSVRTHRALRVPRLKPLGIVELRQRPCTGTRCNSHHLGMGLGLDRQLYATMSVQ